MAVHRGHQATDNSSADFWDCMIHQAAMMLPAKTLMGGEKILLRFGRIHEGSLDRKLRTLCRRIGIEEQLEQALAFGR